MIKSRRLRWTDRVARMEEVRNSFAILTNNQAKEKGFLGRTSRTWKENTRMDLKQISINTRNWVD
jgi:hypothetical protein